MATFIFDEEEGETYFRNDTEKSKEADIGNIFSLEKIENELKTIEMQEKSYKHFDDVFENWTGQISKMNLEHEKENTIYKLLSELFEASKQTCLAELEVFTESAKEIENINASFDYILKKISTRSTRFKRDKEMKKNPLYVQPSEKAIGIQWLPNAVDSSGLIDWKLADTTFHYVSPIETIQSLFKCDQFSKLYFDFNKNKHNCSEGVLLDFCCGTKSKQSEILRNPNTLQIQIALDETELCDGLKTAAGRNKVLAIYMQIRNIPEVYRSRLNTIYLVALCASQNLKENDENFLKICRLIVNDLKILETTGIVVKGNVHLNGALIQILSDNLGENQTFGLIECFSADYFCRFCTSTKKETRTMTDIDPEKIRKKSDYEVVENHYKNGTLASYKPMQGIKKPCIFNELNEFNSFENLSVDIMHDILLRVGSFAIKKLLKWMDKEKIASVSEVVGSIRDFNYGPISKKHKPSLVKLDGKANVGQSAIQMFYLLINLPFIIFKYKEQIGDHFKPIYTLLEIMQIVFSHKVTKDDINRLDDLVKEHLKSMIALFEVKLLPKHHFMLHYKSAFESSGPQVYSMMMHIERKHKTFKDFAKRTNNFTNITKTLAERHQATIFKEFAYADEREPSKRNKKWKLCSDYDEFLQYLPPNLSNDETIQLNFITINGFRYEPNSVVIYNEEIFSINKILTLNDQLYFLCTPYRIVDYDKFCNSIIVTPIENAILKVIDFQDLSLKRSFEIVKVGGAIHIAALVLDFPKTK